jgi:methanogenic corrinoid protein MtbC1
LGEALDRGAAQTPHADGSAFPDDARSLVQSIEGEIVPRLLLAHRTRAAAPRSRHTDVAPTRDELERFLELVLHDSTDATHKFVDELIGRGLSEETLFLDVLGHTARRLGELWEEDLCDFSEVTIGLCRLHEVLREQSVRREASITSRSADDPRILLATACGDQHVFGVVMVAEFFRRACWRVWSEPGAQRRQLIALLAETPFDVVGLSASCAVLVPQLRKEIDALREASCNGQLRVLVGGRLFDESPELAARVGADATATDARSAPEIALRLRTQAIAAVAR